MSPGIAVHFLRFVIAMEYETCVCQRPRLVNKFTRVRLAGESDWTKSRAQVMPVRATRVACSAE